MTDNKTATELRLMARLVREYDYAEISRMLRKAADELEQATAATLGSGTLTAEQVMAIAAKHQPDYCSDTHVCFDWQAIADDLNGELGSGTCEIDSTIWHDHGGYDSDTYEFVLSCGHSIEWLNREPPNYCSDCGKKVK